MKGVCYYYLKESAVYYYYLEDSVYYYYESVQIVYYYCLEERAVRLTDRLASPHPRREGRVLRWRVRPILTNEAPGVHVQPAQRLKASNSGSRASNSGISVQFCHRGFQFWH